MTLTDCINLNPNASPLAKKKLEQFPSFILQTKSLAQHSKQQLAQCETIT